MPQSLLPRHSPVLLPVLHLPVPCSRPTAPLPLLVASSPHPQGLDRYQLSHPLVSSVLFLSPQPRDTTTTNNNNNISSNSCTPADTSSRDLAAHPHPHPHGAPATHHMQQQGDQPQAPVWLGGPTLVLDQSPAGCCCPDCVALTQCQTRPPGDPAKAATKAREAAGSAEPEALRAPLAQRAWTVWPGRVRGRLLLFPGNRLHGVLPGPVGQQADGEGVEAAGLAGVGEREGAAGAAHTAGEGGLRAGGVAGEGRRSGGNSSGSRVLGAGEEAGSVGGCGDGDDGPPSPKREWHATGGAGFEGRYLGVGVHACNKSPVIEVSPCLITSSVSGDIMPCLTHLYWISYFNVMRLVLASSQGQHA